MTTTILAKVKHKTKQEFSVEAFEFPTKKQANLFIKDMEKTYGDRFEYATMVKKEKVKK